jgi:DNA-binding MarR family transcriptional regulator
MSDRCQITSLTARAYVTRQAISKNLRTMEQAELLRSVRHGREGVWQLERDRLDEARHFFDLISRQWDDALPA